MKKNFLWNIIGAGANAFTSLVFIVIVTRINGITDAGIFSYCFATACLLYFIGVYAGRIFQVTDTNTKITDWDYIYNRFFTCIIMLIVSVGFAFLKPNHTIYKAIILVILCTYKDIEAISEVLYGIIQKREQLYKVGISMFLKAISSILIFLITDYFTQNLLLSSSLMIVVNILFILTYDLYNIKELNINRNKYNRSANKVILQQGFFTFVLSFLAIFLINIPRYAINDILEDNLQAIFGIIIMPATFMGLLGQFIIQPFLVTVKKLLINQDKNGLIKIIIKLSIAMIIIGLFVTIVAYLLGIPVLEFIYGIDLISYKTAFMIIIIGSIFYSLNIIFSAILVAMRKTLSQSIVYLAISIIGVIIAYWFVNVLGIIGACITYLIIMISVTQIFLIIMSKNIYQFQRMEKNGEII